MPYLAFKEPFRSLYPVLLLIADDAAGDAPEPVVVRKRVRKSAANVRDSFDFMV